MVSPHSNLPVCAALMNESLPAALDSFTLSAMLKEVGLLHSVCCRGGYDRGGYDRGGYGGGYDSRGYGGGGYDRGGYGSGYERGGYGG